MSRTKGIEAAMKIVDLLEKELSFISDIDAKETLTFILDESKMMTFSFLDEIVRRTHHFLSNRGQNLIFEINSGKRSQNYDKLARISGFRNINIFYKSKLSNNIRRVTPKLPQPLPDFQFEEKPDTDKQH